MHAFQERLHAPVSWWLGAVIFAIACGWVILVATTLSAGLVTMIVVGAATLIGIALYGRVTVAVDESSFHAGSAVLPRRYVGEVTVIDTAEWRHYMGPSADARAYVLSRPYLQRGVMVEVTDPSDPAPYWLVSSRRPQDITDALTATTFDDETFDDGKDSSGEGEENS